MNCAQYPLLPMKVVAIAKDGYLKPKNPFADPANLPATAAPAYGQDITSGVGRAAPGKQSVGKTPADLVPKMKKLLTTFASGDSSGMAKRLFDAFLLKQSAVTYFDDAALNTAAAKHQHIERFCNAALSAPSPGQLPSGTKRIHQALKDANWDIKRLIAPADLGVPAFNEGSKWFSTGDFDNGLGLMINGVQYVYVLAKNYHYDASGRYCIGLKYLFYDVFGLDDDDLLEFGAASDSVASSTAGVGITAWWQLQHQHGYAPLVTRITIEKDVEVAAT